MSVTYLKERSTENLTIVEYCLTNKDKVEYWNALTTRIYYAVFQHIKAKLFDWYVDLYWPSCQTDKSCKEINFFAHDTIRTRLDEFVRFYSNTLTESEQRTLNKIWGLQTARLDSDYGKMTREDIEDFLKDAKDIIAILTKLKA
jgi:hypothetical protein